jgi:hypothetical protein
MMNRVIQLLDESRTLVEEGRRWLDAFNSGSEDRQNEYRSFGGELAGRLRSKAMDLGSNKATEFSEVIQTLILSAAKVAVLTFGTASPEIAIYERDIYYYRAFPGSHAYVDEYDAFKRIST